VLPQILEEVNRRVWWRIAAISKEVKVYILILFFTEILEESI
jgi:hypothetical protein